MCDTVIVDNSYMNHGTVIKIASLLNNMGGTESAGFNKILDKVRDGNLIKFGDAVNTIKKKMPLLFQKLPERFKNDEFLKGASVLSKFGI